MPDTNRTAQYKSRTYRLEFLGETKFGRRAKLAFLDGTKTFWVDAGLVTETTGAATVTRTAPSRRHGPGAGGGAPSVPGYASYCTDNAYCRCYDCAS